MSENTLLAALEGFGRSQVVSAKITMGIARSVRSREYARQYSAISVKALLGLALSLEAKGLIGEAERKGLEVKLRRFANQIEDNAATRKHTVTPDEATEISYWLKMARDDSGTYVPVPGALPVAEVQEIEGPQVSYVDKYLAKCSGEGC